MTDREKLIDLICESINAVCLDGCNFYPKKKCSHCRYIADQLIANGVTFATDTNVGSKWIPVTERLPEPFVSVLVYMPGERPLPTVHEGYVASDGNWYAHFFVREVHEVTHWMPLPESQEEE